MQKTTPQKKKKAKKQRVLFSLEAADAKEVYLVGEFNDWNSGTHPMAYDGNGKWVKPLLLPEGVFEYKFLVDDEWVTDPQCEMACINCFGTRNSIISVAT